MEHSTPRTLSTLLYLLLLISLPLATLSASCSDDGAAQTEEESDEIDCNDNEYYDQVSEKCVPRFGSQDDEEEDGGLDAGASDTEDDTSSDPGETDGSNLRDGTESGDADAEEADTFDCDKDNDRALAPECGGDDCDDEDPRRSPHIDERCDTVDNNCSGEVNDGLDCTFFAHEDETLYKINPFEKTATEVEGQLPGLHDLDTHPDGTLFGVTPEGFYRFDQSTNTWEELKAFPESASWAPADPNGLAIDRSGGIYITSEDTLYTVEKQTENGETSWWVEPVGTMGTTPSGAEYRSSGDAVVNKTTLYMTSKHDPDEDHLVTLDPETGQASDAKAIGYQNVFGLTTAWGTVYGLTLDGELIEIEQQTGASKLIHNFDRSWYGAASTPRRK